ncbi:DUF167 domain-containing protein [Alienimonas californiensis]|uniref:UPF0235 protein CA12_25250 n=1 Tax=Alienimonas californiensis TaxID=2527989 RepID=A0A517PAM4_9PLAN|nr:DUF167 domain-containing protein [Alienimonas californiensis]QDT16423.1 hypothetical protein CA12_25250 [Alienimonas californiensis]
MTAAPAATLTVKVVPGASRSAVVGWLGEALKVRVAAPPERGKANAAVLALLAEALGVPQQAVTLAAGPTSPRKTIRVEGLSNTEVRRRLGG